MAGLWIVVGVLLAATVFGIWNRRTSGTIKASAPSAAPELPGIMLPGITMATPDDPLAEIESDAAYPPPGLLSETLSGRLGERATVVQFSSAFCQPCRATRRILEEVTTMVPGVAHVEIDAEDHLDLVRELGIRRTPTVLFLDAAGIQRKHASGLPRKADVIAALGEIIPGSAGDFEI
jgi:thiol-disulfide isomerase/thioredoxin